MKKILTLCFSLMLFSVACSKIDDTGIPPVGNVQLPSNNNLPLLEAINLTASDYVVGKQVQIHGNIVVESGRSYFVFKDGTKVQIYAKNFSAISQDAKTKLATNGQEVTVSGKFENHTLKNGEVIKEIIYQSEADLKFGTSVTPTTPAETLEASTATDKDYVAGKTATIHGNIVVESGRSYFKFSDGTMVQIFAHKSDYDKLSKEVKDKLKLEGQEVTVTGVFTNFTPKGTTLVIKEIVFKTESDLKFGTSVAPITPAETLEASTAKASDYVVGKTVSLHGNIVLEGTKSYFKFSDGTMVQIFARNTDYEKLSKEVKDKLKTEGQEVTVTGKFTDYEDKKQNKIIKEIIFKTESDLAFGTTPSTPTTPTAPVSLEVANLSASDYAEGKQVKLHGIIGKVVTTSKGGKLSFFVLNDGTEIQIYAKNFSAISQDAKNKLATEGQEVTVTGKFETYKNTKEIVYQSEADLVFGTITVPTTPTNPTTPPTTTPTNPTTPPATTAEETFVFKDIKPNGKETGYTSSGTLQHSGVSITYTNARTGLVDSKTKADYSIDGSGLMFKKDGSITVNFSTKVKELKFSYRAAYTSTAKRKIVVYDSSNRTLQTIEFGELNKTTEAVVNLSNVSPQTITIKCESDKQVVINNLKWSK